MLDLHARARLTPVDAKTERSRIHQDSSRFTVTQLIEKGTSPGSSSHFFFDIAHGNVLGFPRRGGPDPGSVRVGHVHRDLAGGHAVDAAFLEGPHSLLPTGRSDGGPQQFIPPRTSACDARIEESADSVGEPHGNDVL